MISIFGVWRSTREVFDYSAESNDPENTQKNLKFQNVFLRLVDLRREIVIKRYT